MFHKFYPHMLKIYKYGAICSFKFIFIANNYVLYKNKDNYISKINTNITKKLNFFGKPYILFTYSSNKYTQFCEYFCYEISILCKSIYCGICYPIILPFLLHNIYIWKYYKDIHILSIPYRYIIPNAYKIMFNVKYYKLHYNIIGNVIGYERLDEFIKNESL